MQCSFTLTGILLFSYPWLVCATTFHHRGDVLHRLPHLRCIVDLDGVGDHGSLVSLALLDEVTNLLGPGRVRAHLSKLRGRHLVVEREGAPILLDQHVAARAGVQVKRLDDEVPGVGQLHVPPPC